MIISRTPFRISFFGGGTDYPVWLKENDGAVLATTIDKYCYLTCRYLPPFFEHKSRIAYSLIEYVQNNNEFKHPSARECLNFMKIASGIEIHHDGDLPARTGLGSSSSFTVGLLNSLYALKRTMVSPLQLAKDSIVVEQNYIKENVGCQDQIMAAFGGFNLVEFKPGGNFQVHPVIIPNGRLKELQQHLMLIFTGFSRIASEIAANLIDKMPQRQNEMKEIHKMVYQALRILKDGHDISDFGKMLHESWLLKRSLTDNISNRDIDDIYEAARKGGAIGGKLLGAGGGGFLLLFAKPKDHANIKKKLGKLLHVPFQFDGTGSQIVFFKHDETEFEEGRPA